MTPFERSLSKLSENQKILEIGFTEFKLWQLKESLHKCVPLSSLQRLTEHAQCVTFQTMPQLHPDWVRRISYVWHNHSFISCSNSPINSLVMRDVGRKRKSYIFRVRKVGGPLTLLAVLIRFISFHDIPIVCSF